MRYDGTLLHHFVQIQLLDLYNVHPAAVFLIDQPTSRGGIMRGEE